MVRKLLIVGALVIASGALYLGTARGHAGSHIVSPQNATPASASEGGTLTVTVNITPPTDTGETVTVGIGCPGTGGANPAQEGADYTCTDTTLTFAAGDPSEDFSINILSDGIDEENETLDIVFTNPQCTGVVGCTATAPQNILATIMDDDLPPTITINDPSVTEGNSGQTPMTFTLSKNGSSAKVVTLSATTADGTAVAPGDYASKSSTVTFQPTDATQPFVVNVNGDATVEPHEHFFVNLTNSSNATIADTQGKGTITDDEPAATANVSDGSATEGNAAVFTVSLSQPCGPGQQAFIPYDTRDANGSPTGTASENVDYTRPPPGSFVTISQFESSKTFSIPTTNDTEPENAETFGVFLGVPTGSCAARVSDGVGLGTINDNDVDRKVNVGDATAEEGNAATFTISLTTPCTSGQTMTVPFDTRSFSPPFEASGTATEDADYPRTQGTATIPAGGTSTTVSVPTTEDALEENNETFSLFIGAPGGTCAGERLDGQGQGTITDDDLPRQVLVGDASANEGDNITFNVSLTQACPAGQTVTVPFDTRNAQGQPIGTATETTDYARTQGTLTFNPGDLTKQVLVPTVEDAAVEANETLTLFLGAPTGTCPTSVNDDQGVGTIVNDDAQRQVAISDAASSEGDSMTFTVTINESCGAEVLTIPFDTRNASDQPVGTATEGGDYPRTLGTLTFSLLETTETIMVNTAEDVLTENDEDFRVFLGPPGGSCTASIPDSEAVGVIVDDDGPQRTVSVNDTIAQEGNIATFTLTLNRACGGNQSVTVPVDTRNAQGQPAGTATEGADYPRTTGSVVFNAGELTKTFNVATTEDTAFEGDETFSLFIGTLTGNCNTVVGDGQGIGTIDDDDIGGTLFINRRAVFEADTANRICRLTVELDPTSGATVTVDYTTQDKTATAGSDYIANSGTLTFAPGESAKTIDVTVLGDRVAEDREKFFVRLSNPVGAQLEPQSKPAKVGRGRCLIIDDD